MIRRSHTRLGHALAVLGVAVVLACSVLPSAATAQGPLAPADVRFEGFVVPPTGGSIERWDGTAVLHLEGDLAERGFAEGYLCAEELLACFHEFALDHAVAGRAKAWELLVPFARAQFRRHPEWSDVLHQRREA